jgi:GDPmannose 4,6-dehydratase
VEAQWLMLQQDQADDFVIATGIQHSVRDFVNHAASCMGVELAWQGEGEEEHAVVSSSPEAHKGLQPGDVIVRVDPRYYRPAEVETLLGDASRARDKLGWSPRTTFEEMVEEMVESDLRSAREEALIHSTRQT